jgi:hypothetical protein
MNWRLLKRIIGDVYLDARKKRPGHQIFMRRVGKNPAIARLRNRNYAEKNIFDYIDNDPFVRVTFVSVSNKKVNAYAYLENGHKQLNHPSRIPHSMSLFRYPIFRNL